jgi:exopolyphosphatase / guanosine-5'-triphosphate,3'-diphosphate pyrophosphatase
LPSEERLAVIDLGSNTCRLVIFEFSPQLSFRLVDEISERVRIAERMYGTNRLQPMPMARTLRLLKLFRELCDANGIERIVATASSAVREAENGPDFLSRVREETLLDLRVLTGHEEAYYAYLGAVNSLAITGGIVADLGGGSLELTRVGNRLPIDTASLPLGAVRLTERFLPGRSIRPTERRRLIDFVDAELTCVDWLQIQPGEKLVALGGTVRALANMHQRAIGYGIDRIHSFEMTRKVVKAWARDLLDLPLKDRRKLPGMREERVDVIPAGAVVISRLLKHAKAPVLTVSGRGLREGLFYGTFMGGERAAAFNLSGLPLIPHIREFGVANFAFLYGIDWRHSGHVCNLALSLFDQLREQHRCGHAERELLGFAAIMHDAGVVIDYYRHQYHSAYLIENADLPGFTHRESAIISLLVRWHRHGRPTSEPFQPLLQKGDTSRVRRLAAILRLAEDLERSRAQVVVGVRCAIRNHAIQVEALTRDTAGAELWAANRDDDVFQYAYGLKLHVRAVPVERDPIPDGVNESENVFSRAHWLAERLRPCEAGKGA